ncbi:MAG: sigma 54-interacting transcriptional regulator [Pyrinomonadaceae bacterium]
MNPRVLVVTGPARGSAVELAESLSVGRDTDNALRIKHLSVSRHHCVIERRGESFVLIDRSRYGTFVNHVPIKERQLEHGDEITVGESLMVFLCHEDKAEQELNTVQLNEAGGVTLSAIRLRREDVPYLRPELGGALQPVPRLTRDLGTLLRASTQLGSDCELGALYEHLLDSAMETIPAAYGSVLRVEGESREYVVCASRSRTDGIASTPSGGSTSAVMQVVREGVAILAQEMFEGARALKGASSNTTAYSVLCAPLRKGGDTAEVVYLVSEAGGSFEERHLEWLTALAVIASPAAENIHRRELLQSENKRLLREAVVNHDMIGESAAMREVYQLIAKVAPKDSTVLIRGESGTGKELAAYAIHANSPREGHPFLAVNCATLTETLLESELFGHEKGAFTGAFAQKKGRLEVADGGTFFLDEVGETTPAVQAKLLRVLQKRVVERVGGSRQIKIDVRLIAATNKDLEEAVRQGAFREDLYYRLNVIELNMPPLRERREDIPLLATYFARRCGDRCKRRVMGISPEAMECLLAHDWRGNVRELENSIERAVVLGGSELIMAEDLPPHLLASKRTSAPKTLSLKAALREKKEEIIREAVARAKGNYTEAARLLDIHPNNLHRHMRALNLKARMKI